MSIGAELGQYFANTIQKNSEDLMGGEFERPLWVRRCSFVSKDFWSKVKERT